MGPKNTEVENELSMPLRYGYGLLLFLSQVLLFGCLGLCIFWIIYYGGGVAWVNDTSKQFNLHYVLMIGGFIFMNGQSILVYKNFLCWKKKYNKVIHTIFFALEISAITIGLMSAIRGHNNSSDPKHFYSLHSWIGLGTLGLFSLQFVVGFIVLLTFLACDATTTKFRHQLEPTHRTFGLIIFSMAVATCVAGLIQTARHRLSGKDGKEDYKDLREQGIVINVLGMIIISLGILLPYVIRSRSIEH
ncbi:lysosomal membrane ascorbate-dependent ferrireductase CYB561A3-like isoform X1 [Tachypleus tridentatus]|uniref:lysosomal membrane ascorbate-dependent ferrireductase CYB561A3-like isoform X1 n=2 Tax=Tachypleus tridentatus TaxID=6853 RepID=UPI003FD19B80